MAISAAEAAEAAEAPAVRFEACAAFHGYPGASWPVCDACGWLEGDHGEAAVDAVVTELPRRYPPRIERKAS
jgi:hypothetical protein